MPSFNKSALAFDDIKPLFERALETPKGLRITLPTKAAAVQLRHRMNYYRGMDRKANAETYPAGHPSHGTSVYDRLVLRIEGEIVIMEKRSMDDLKVEEIE